MSNPPTTKLKTKPSYYSPFSFHAVRTISALSSVVVSGILVFFCIELKNEGYKIPWTFLIVSGLSLDPLNPTDCSQGPCCLSFDAHMATLYATHPLLRPTVTYFQHATEYPTVHTMALRNGVTCLGHLRNSLAFVHQS